MALVHHRIARSGCPEVDPRHQSWGLCAAWGKGKGPGGGGGGMGKPTLPDF